ncbi:hypothetical protein TrLO_g1846 [Triparma laevis f. longispina]|uniref:Glutaredoxin domain-containing protein n=1 Tax=Triparma laevis f. longispina TaxID=1714387 RepID=A0A9W7E6N5_9STRA|nr:hypothetical protein TrLO_g1846 [Triparma laevis f. longispina]
MLKLFVFLAILTLASSFHAPVFGVRVRSSSLMMDSGENLRPDFEQETPERTKQRIQDMITTNPVMLFMKGNKMFPQCGFSNTAVQILQSYSIDFETCDVLSDEAIRNGVKDFSNWPTIPQLYVAGEFVGGTDIMIEEYQNGNLAEVIEKAKADMI